MGFLRILKFLERWRHSHESLLKLRIGIEEFSDLGGRHDLKGRGWHP
jgi:hypothetical protein